MAGRTASTTILFTVSLFVLTVFLFAPARIYLGNFMEYSFLFHESMLFFLIVSLVLICVLFTAVFLLSRNKKRGRIVVSALFATAFLMWLQGNIILWQYGVLNGIDIEWNTLVRYGIIDSAIWLLVLTFSIVKAGLVARISRFMSILLIVVQLLTVSQAWIAMPKNQDFKRKATGEETLFKFSNHVNVVILVLDTLQSDIFQDIIREDDALRASFDGFTYFRNSLAGSDGTIVSVPNMLSGNNYDNSVPYLEFVKSSFLENSITKTLREYGFVIDLYPILDYSVYNDFSGVRLSGKRLMNWDAFFKEQAFIADLALFRCLPHFVKKTVYNDQRWFISGLWERYQDSGKAADASGAYSLKFSREYENSRGLIKRNWDARFINKLIPASAIIENADVFKFYHLNGVHLQLVMNENLEYESLAPTRANMKRQGTGVLKIAAIFLERLRQMGVYDDSLIFIVGDHGSGLAAAHLNASAHADDFNRTGPYKGCFKSFKTAGIPMILAKRIDAKGGLRTTDAPVSLGDIPQTVVEELGLKGEFPGKSMFSVGEKEERERIYRAFVGPQDDVEYLAPLYEYAVKGFSWDDASWRETGNVYYAKEK